MRCWLTCWSLTPTHRVAALLYIRPTLWGWRQNRSSKAGKVLLMRSHEACYFSMMKTNVPNAVVTMG